MKLNDFKFNDLKYAKNLRYAVTIAVKYIVNLSIFCKLSLGT